MRRRSSIAVVLEKSCRIPAASEVAGNRVSPNAAIAPVMLTTIVTASATSVLREALAQRSRPDAV